MRARTAIVGAGQVWVEHTSMDDKGTEGSRFHARGSCPGRQMVGEGGTTVV